MLKTKTNINFKTSVSFALLIALTMSGNKEVRGQKKKGGESELQTKTVEQRRRLGRGSPSANEHRFGLSCSKNAFPVIEIGI